jgi:transcriptional regulator with XRE-family HTH domain
VFLALLPEEKMTEQDLRQIFSANIKRFRKQNDLSQEKLAEKTDISTNFLSDIETCKGWVSPKTLVKLAEALSVDVADLFKAERTKAEDISTIIDRCFDDVADGIKVSIGKSIEQSLENIREYYVNKDN